MVSGGFRLFKVPLEVDFLRLALSLLVVRIRKIICMNCW